MRVLLRKIRNFLNRKKNEKKTAELIELSAWVIQTAHLHKTLRDEIKDLKKRDKND